MTLFAQFHIQLLAQLTQRNPFSDMGAGFRDKKEHFDGTELLMYVLLIALVFCLIAGIAWIINRRDRRQFYSSPRALFRALCRIHRLDRSQRKLVASIAVAEGLVPQGRVFLEPRAFEQAAHDPTFQHRRTEIEQIARRIFASGNEAGSN
jgi:hypothetical protein